ncbi:MAG: hypothetical protein GY711_32210 [bacterium]|nr:hypothetical protein [bacterium]
MPKKQPKKHLILVHGRATKPSENEKTRLVKKALLHGITRTDAEAAKAIRSGKVKFSLAYYGDISNQVMLKHDPKLAAFMTEKDPAHDDLPCECCGSYDNSLDELLARKTNQFTRKEYMRFLGTMPDRRWLDNFADVASVVGSVLRISTSLIRGASPDMAAYLTHRRDVGSPVRQRLQTILRPALERGDDICLVAHSMGCLVAYDVLWKFSSMSEYLAVRDKRVNMWLTLGNPLGEPGVRNNLYDAHEHEDGKYPRNAIDSWVNITAIDDFVAHDQDIADDFRAMKERRYLRRIVDRPRIYTFWHGYDGSNPHKLYAYLDHPKVGAEIAKWVRRPPK